MSRRVRESVFAMSLYAYFKRTTGLPVPNGSLSGSISPQAIAAANREVEIYTKSKEKTASKRGSYKRSVKFIWLNVCYIMFLGTALS